MLDNGAPCPKHVKASPLSSWPGLSRPSTIEFAARLKIRGCPALCPGMTKEIGLEALGLLTGDHCGLRPQSV
jgi:hypothetical protein